MDLKKIALVASGEILNYTATRSLIKKFDRVIAVDGGLHHCEKMEIAPDAIYGDMDSISPSCLKKFSTIPSSLYPTEKDDTDLALAVKAEMKEGIYMAVFGGLGKRTDHAIANMFLLHTYPARLFLETEDEYLFSLPHEITIQSEPGQIVSLFPMGEMATGVTTHGLKWELADSTLDVSFYSISNVAESHQLHIKVKNGSLLCCLQKVFKEDLPLHPLPAISLSL